MGWVQKGQARTAHIVPLLLVIVLAILSGGVVCYGQADGQQSAPARLDLNVVDLELSKIVQMLMRDSKQSIVIRDQEDLGKKKVTATLNDLPFEKVLQKVVESVGGSVDKDADGVYVISARSSNSDSTMQSTYKGGVTPADSGLPGRGRGESSRSVPARDTITDIIKVYNTSAQDMAFLLTHTGTDYAADSGRFLKFEDNTNRTQKNTGLYLPKSDGSVYPAPDGTQASVPTNESLHRTGQEANRAPSLDDGSISHQAMPGGMMGGSDSYGGGMGSSGGMGGNMGGMGGGMGSTGASGRSSRGMLPDTIDWVIPYPMDNSLIVKGDEEGIAELKELIRKLDIVPKQIMIKAEFVSINTNEAERLGVEWSAQRLNTTFATTFGPSGNIALGYANGNVMAQLAAEIQDSRAKLVNAPMISTMNNVPGQISFNTSIPYWTGTSVLGNGSAATSTSVQFLTVSTNLMVLPRVSPADNSITVYVTPQISDIGSEVTGPDGSTIPQVNTQGLSAIARVGNGETFVLGGIVRKQDSVSKTGIPFLKDLPIVGPLFSNTVKNNDDTETLIFVTPTIRPEKPIAGAGVGVVSP